MTRNGNQLAFPMIGAVVYLSDTVANRIYTIYKKAITIF